MKKKQRLRLQILTGVALGCAVAFGLWMRRELQPMPEGASFYLRYQTPQKTSAVLQELFKRGVVRDPGAMRIYGIFRHAPDFVAAGSYRFHPGETALEIVSSLKRSIEEMVRLPDTNWARRNANLLEKADVTSAADYLALVNDPTQFKNQVAFPLPKHSLEGYLYPDTYDLPPLLGARPVVERQLQAFQDKVWDVIPHTKDLNKIVTIASLVQLEAGADEDRPMIAGVIYNRLNKGMPLQIDASLLYAEGKWRRLHFKDYKGIVSPYNLYLHKGLPPTPICSPNLKSIQAALNPAKHDYLFYVAGPGGHSLFSKTFEEHKKKIQQSRAALKETKP